MPPNGPSDSRPQSSSLAGRVRSLNVFSSSGGASVPQDPESSGDQTPAASFPGNNGHSLGEEVLQSFDRSQDLETRVFRLTETSKNFAFYDEETLFSILNVVHDFTGNSAPSAARKIAFILLRACASVPGLSDERRQQLLLAILEPVDSLGLEYQMDALGQLTQDGLLINNLDATQLVRFLVNTLQSQTTAVFDARKKVKIEAEKHRTRDTQREKGLHAVLEILSKFVASNPSQFSASNVNALVNGLLFIAENTTSKIDMRKVASALGTFIRAQRLPDTHLNRCVEVSCAILNAMPDLREYFWEDVLSLLSSKQVLAVDVLFSVLSLKPENKHTYAICGAMSVLHFLVINQGNQDLPRVTFPSFIQHLLQLRFAGRRTRRDCLKCILSLLEDNASVEKVLATKWGDMTFVILAAAKDEASAGAEGESLQAGSTGLSRSRASDPFRPATEPAGSEMSEQLNGLSEAFATLWPRLNREQKDCVAKFHHQLKAYLPPEALRNLIAVVQEDLQITEVNGSMQSQFEIAQMFVLGRDIETSACCTILAAFKAQLPKIRYPQGLSDFAELSELLLKDFPIHAGDVSIANALADLVTAFWKLHQPPNLHDTLPLIWPLLHCGHHTLKISASDSQQPAIITENVVTERLVDLFVAYLTVGAPEAAVTFNLLLGVAKDRKVSTQQRLQSLALLTSLRSDAQGIIVLFQDGNDPTSGHDSQAIDEGIVQEHTPFCWAKSSSEQEAGTLMASEWLLVVLELLQQPGDLQVLQYVLARLPCQLSNTTLFAFAVPHIKHLRNIVTSQLKNGGFPDHPETSNAKTRSKGYQDTTEPSELRRVSLDAHHVQILITLLGYAAHFSPNENEDIARTFLAALGGSKAAKKNSIHALTTCYYVIPSALLRSLPAVLQKMSQIITQTDLAVDILEFLGGLARLPETYVNFREEEFRTVFAICVRYLEHSREQRLTLVSAQAASSDYTSNRLSELSVKSSTPTHETSRSDDTHTDLPQYVFTLAYHVLTIWFLSLKVTDRSNFVGWITKNLAWTDANGNERMEEQSQVALDMMHRTAYLDLGETESRTVFSDADGEVLRKTWLVGLSLLTVETATRTGLSKLVKRQASGTTFATYQPNTAPLPPHHAPPPTDVLESLSGPQARINIFPNHVFLQIMSNIAPVPVPMEPICLPDDDATKRAIAAFDRMDTVDGYRVGVLYVGNRQSQETEIFGNTRGSAAYEHFLSMLGTKVRLKGARFNTQGLDRERDSDGEYTIAWRDRVAELVFHVPTLMPTDKEHDPQCVHKKKHCGNDFVNIIFNESGLPWKVETIPSQFNRVNIVITPENLMGPVSAPSSPVGHADDKSYYTIQTVSRPSFPEISPAASPKLVPLSTLATFVRQLALHTAVFCNVWANREVGENVSSWKSRLREIKKLREKFINTGTSASAKYPGAKSVRSYANGDSFKGTIEMGGLVEEEGILMGLDFSRWAGPNPPLV